MQLVNDMDDLLKNLPIEAEQVDPNKWHVIYKGVLNPQSHQGYMFRKSLD